MQIAYGHAGGGPEFFVRLDDDEGWTPLSRLGLVPGDSGELAGVADRIPELLRTDHGPGVDLDRLESPVIRPRKILAVGLNYRDHIAETAAQAPESPMIFAKYTSSVSGPFDSIVSYPAITSKLDYEGELAVIMRTGGRWIPQSEALEHVLGYAVSNDVSARDLQRADRQFSRSKSFDTFCPIGPWITTADAVPDPQALGIRTRVNGAVRQDGTTADMIFSVAYVISFLSQTMTWEPGDVLLTGTPAGVILGMPDPVFLTDGDEVEVEIDGVGTIRNRVRFDG